MVARKQNLRFGIFEIDFERGELWKRGKLIPLQEQPFRLLSLLLAQPGQLITRDELRAQIWPVDTFVDFDASLNIAVMKVRHALGDSATHPRFIETVPRHGYRFIAGVEPAGSPATGGAAETNAEDSKAATETGTAHASGRVQRLIAWIGIVMVAAFAGSAFSHRFLQRSAVPTSSVPVSLTGFSGFEGNPSVSPDGKGVAFTWDGENQDNFDIYISALPKGSRPLVRVTTNPADDFSPAWSPDGQKIAFVRRSGADFGELLVVPVSGGREQKLADIRNREIGLLRLLSLSWSTDGQWVSASHRDPADEAESIYAFSLTGERRRLTSPPKGYYGDYMPAISPNGKALAFCRLAGFSTSEIHLLELGRNWLPEITPRRITTERRWSMNPVWMREGKSLLHLFSEHPEARHELRVIDVSDMSSHAVSIPPEAREISAGTHLVYSRRILETNIWRARIPRRGQPPAIPERFISSTQGDEKPAYSPDGHRIAFVSKRSGSDEIWVANADGANPVRMTHFGGPLVGVVNWSPNGQWLVFHARPEGQADVFAIPAAGGSPIRLTSDPADDTMPSYSRDGRWIYFGSRRSGDYAIWKMSSTGGAATQLAGPGGAKPLESVDGTTVYYYSWPATSAILSIPSGGGQPVKVIDPIHTFPLAFAVTAEGIFYPAPPHSGQDRYIRFFRFRTGQADPVVMVKRPFRLGMTVSPDGNFIAFDQLDGSGSDLMLVQDFELR